MTSASLTTATSSIAIKLNTATGTSAMKYVGFASMTFETANVTSAQTNQKVILERGAHVWLMQEQRLTLAQIKNFQALATMEGERFEGVPFDPEHGMVFGGVGILSMEGIIVHPITETHPKTTKMRWRLGDVPLTDWTLEAPPSP